MTPEQMQERMRVAPEGAFYCPDCGEIMEEARVSGRIGWQCDRTHGPTQYSESYLNGLHRGWREVLAAPSARQEPDPRITELETTLDYVASCYHIAMHGIKEAKTWQECDRQPCRVANGRKPSVRKVDPSPPSDEPQPQRPANEPPVP